MKYGVDVASPRAAIKSIGRLVCEMKEERESYRLAAGSEERAPQSQLRVQLARRQ